MRLKRCAIGATSAVVMVALAFVLSTSVEVSSATSAGAATRASMSAFYLDLGASISVGVQPTLATPKGHPTDDGYANDLVTIEAREGISLELTELGCPGETLATTIYGGDRCYHGTGTQLSDAVAFLKAHFNETGLVTVDLGYNNFSTCLHDNYSNMTCAEQQVTVVRQQLAQVLSTLNGAAGPNVTFIGIGHYDPYLASFLRGIQGRILAANSMPVIRLFNKTLRGVYSSFSIPMVNVNRAFDASNKMANNVTLAASVPESADRICALTWMCQPPPYGPNIHPNDAGYRLMASVISVVLGTAEGFDDN
jgi:hypothetical protein